MFCGYERIISEHKPRGYEIRRRPLKAADGYAEHISRITVDSSLRGNEALFVALHEFGHVHYSHLAGTGLPRWLEEYEADQYAIGAMRKENIPIPRERLRHQKAEVARLIAESKTSEVPGDEVLKYAFGKDWRKHRT